MADRNLPDWKAARARLGGLTRLAPDDTERIEQARADLVAARETAERDAALDKVLASRQPLPPERRAELAAWLNGDAGPEYHQSRFNAGRDAELGGLLDGTG
jgi:hypothetical protein